jgi:hypothetical protein
MSDGRIEPAPKSTPICHSVHWMSWFWGADPFFFLPHYCFSSTLTSHTLVSKFNILPSIFALPTNEAHVLTYYIHCARLSYPPTYHLSTYLTLMWCWHWEYDKKYKYCKNPLLTSILFSFQPLSSMQVLHFVRLPHTLKAPHTIQYLLHMVYLFFKILLFNYFSLF